MTFGLTVAALAVGQPVPAAAQTTLPYPWCSVGERAHCDYMTLQQCEEAVDYHGFCEPNPDPPAPSSQTRRAYPQ